MVAEQVDGFRVSVHDEGDATVLTVQGELDMATAPELRDALAAVLLAGPARVIIDGHLLTFIDSTGLSALLLAERRCRTQGGELLLRNATDTLRRLITLAGVAGVLRGEDDG